MVMTRKDVTHIRKLLAWARLNADEPRMRRFGQELVNWMHYRDKVRDDELRRQGRALSMFVELFEPGANPAVTTTLRENEEFWEAPASLLRPILEAAGRAVGFDAHPKPSDPEAKEMPPDHDPDSPMCLCDGCRDRIDDPEAGQW